MKKIAFLMALAAAAPFAATAATVQTARADSVPAVNHNREAMNFAAPVINHNGPWAPAGQTMAG